jgi:hypothetical protein
MSFLLQNRGRPPVSGVCSAFSDLSLRPASEDSSTFWDDLDQQQNRSQSQQQQVRRRTNKTQVTIRSSRINPVNTKLRFWNIYILYSRINACILVLGAFTSLYLRVVIIQTMQ